jgi:integrase
MPDRTPRVPRYRQQKARNLAVVRIDGRDVYLGRYDSPESHEKYRRVVAEWLSGSPPEAGGGRPGTPDPGGGPSVTAVLVAFMRHAERHYRRPDGTPTEELSAFRRTLKPVCVLYGGTPAEDFGPKALKAVRQSMINAGLSLGVVNQRVGRIKRVWKWAVEAEMVPPAAHQALKAVAGLQRGRSGVRTTEPVKPVADADVDAVKPFVSRQVWAMIELQRLTGMRPGEACVIRGADLDTSGPTWVYRPPNHKMSYLGRPRTIFLGSRARAVLTPWLRNDPSEFLFSPREAAAELAAERRRKRKTKVPPSQKRRRRKARPQRAPGVRYTVGSYRCAIQRACDRAGIPTWHPNQIRHLVGTRLRAEFGLDTARAVLGHSSPVVTEIYAEIDGAAARAAIERIG